MSLLTLSTLGYILSIFTALLAVFIGWIKWSYTYWSKKGLFYLPPAFFFGSCKNVFMQKESFGDFLADMYFYTKKHGKRDAGFYFLFMPQYLLADPDLIKRIMQVDFDHFVDRGVYLNEDDDPLSAHLFSLEGAKWKKLRVKLTPTFTSGKMKMMFDTLVICSDQLLVEMNKDLGTPVEVKNILERYTTDIIGNCAFGLNCNSLKDPDNNYTKHLKLFFATGFWRNLLAIVTFITPKIALKLSLKVVHPDLRTWFMKMISETVDYREKNNIYRKDFMHLLLQLKNRGKLSDDETIFQKEEDDTEKITMNELAAQAFVFFAAGFETSSTAMTFCLFELAQNFEIQDKLREEVVRVLAKYDHKLSYEAIMEMHYMEQVINETLRKYPPLPGLNRVCTKDYKIPGTDILLEKGMKVWIPVMGIHRDPEFYPNPDKFDPERFSEKNKRDRHPYTFIPFGEGPRICIGLRFGMMQTKVGLTTLLKNYKFSLNPKTTIPINFDPRSFILTNKGGIWLDYTQV